MLYENKATVIFLGLTPSKFISTSNGEQPAMLSFLKWFLQGADDGLNVQWCDALSAMVFYIVWMWMSWIMLIFFWSADEVVPRPKDLTPKGRTV
jgi:hypothetical protein